MQEENFSPTDSLSLIESMLRQAKSAEKDNGMGWILWGWLLFLASTAHYIAIQLRWQYGQYIWLAFGIVAGVLMLYTVANKILNKRKRKVQTYTGQLLSKLTLAFFISLVVMVYGNAVTGIQKDGLNFGFLLLLYAFWMFIYAAAFRFTLFYWGAALNWLGAVVIFYFRERLGAEVLLVHSVCVGLGYIIPGHIAYNNFHKK